MAKSTEVAKKDDKLPAAASYDYGSMAHEGFEETTIKDLSIPFINVLQSNSPAVEDQTVEGAKAGDLLNSVTHEIMKQPVVLIPVLKEEVWVEWIPRTKGGGLVARHDPDSEVVQGVIKKNGGSRIPPEDADGKRVAFKSPDGNELIETYYVYCLVMDETGAGDPEAYCVLSFSSTKIKVYKDWMTSMYTLKGRPPIFANRAKISTQKQQAKGKSFYNFRVNPFGETWRDSLIVPDEAGLKLLEEGQNFRNMILEGLARPDTDSLSGVRDDDEPSGGGGKSSNDEEMPF